MKPRCLWVFLKLQWPLFRLPRASQEQSLKKACDPEDRRAFRKYGVQIRAECVASLPCRTLSAC